MDISKHIKPLGDPEEDGPVHVDDFVDNCYEYRDEKYTYARWFFLLHRLPAAMQSSFKEYISKYKLFCTYKEKTYRVTGASRLGDVWLTADFNQDTGYQHRVNLDDCSNWRDEP